jgi:hypothetical protein
MQCGVTSLKIRKLLPLFPADHGPMVVLVADLLTLAATDNLPHGGAGKSGVPDPRGRDPE